MALPEEIVGRADGEKELMEALKNGHQEDGPPPVDCGAVVGRL